MCKKYDVFGTMLRSTKLSSVFMKNQLDLSYGC